MAPVPRGFQSYGLPSILRPSLAWKLDETYFSTNMFASLTLAGKSGFASWGQLLTVWPEQVPPALEPFVGQSSLLVSAFWRKTEPLVSREHTIQLLEALGTILPAGSMDPRVSALLTGLSCTTFLTWEALYKQLGNLHLLRRESMLYTVSSKDNPTQKILRKAPPL